MAAAEGQPTVEPTIEDVGLRLFDAVSAPAAVASTALRDRYMVPPFTVLDRRSGDWQERVRQWKKLGMDGELGLRSEAGREGVKAYNTDQRNPDITDTLSDTKTISIFDPFLCELAYAWYCPVGGRVLDPFSGGSVRGVIAGSMGRDYTGIDLSERQVVANRLQAETIFAHADGDGVRVPRWIHGDARTVLEDKATPGNTDLVFTCPPYGDLERYSDDPHDLSTMKPDAFDDAYADILGWSVVAMAMDSFAVVVVGNYRAKHGRLRDLVGITVRAMEDAGATYYSEATILDPPGSAAWRAPRQFDASRKLCRVHQHFLVFVKGDGKRATDRIKATLPVEAAA